MDSIWKVPKNWYVLLFITLAQKGIIPEIISINFVLGDQFWHTSRNKSLPSIREGLLKFDFVINLGGSSG